MKYLFLGLAICAEPGQNQCKSNNPKAVNVVLFKFKSEASLEQEQNFKSEMLKKHSAVSGLIDISFGENVTDIAKGFTRAEAARFKDQKSLKVFSKSDPVEELNTSYIKPVLQEILVFNSFS
ncbi:Dabb family protein [Flavobacterium tructae]|uniref:Stress-response A/B barrel domain-containing protein n=1 Tax=Flavobacterium tructae TaxID=1114873 RepID=A0A1S1J3L1_9FLAO|nr:Dabb family protein [Flavobacterium tructae]OHT44211.1 hypothetical protein BHE19_14920 [Flavobacterium tructae]OXB20123.1 hypothetical protein B0A71_08695 [Flavobacterium tructae]